MKFSFFPKLKKFNFINIKNLININLYKSNKDIKKIKNKK